MARLPELRRSSAFVVVQAKLMLPKDSAISPKRSACSFTEASVPWNSTSSIGDSGSESFE